MPLFGGKTELEMRLDADRVVAGESVHVRVGAADEKVTGGKVLLVYENTYQYEERRYDSGGEDTYKTVATKDVRVASAPIYADGAVGEPRELDVELRIPRFGPPSDPDAVVWSVRAVLDRELAVDETRKLPLTVVVGPEANAKHAELEPSTEGDLPMTLALDSRTVRVGDTVTGRLTIRPQEDLKARAVRVQLRRERVDRNDLTDDDVAAKEELDRGVSLPAGETREYDFAIALPPGAAPCFHAKHNHQRWFLEAVVDRRLRADKLARAGLNVYNA